MKYLLNIGYLLGTVFFYYYIMSSTFKLNFLNLLRLKVLDQDLLVRGCPHEPGKGLGGWGGVQNGTLPQISYNDENWHSYTLPKKDPKNL